LIDQHQSRGYEREKRRRRSSWSSCHCSSIDTHNIIRKNTPRHFECNCWQQCDTIKEVAFVYKVRRHHHTRWHIYCTRQFMPILFGPWNSSSIKFDPLNPNCFGSIKLNFILQNQLSTHHVLIFSWYHGILISRQRKKVSSLIQKKLTMKKLN
jgi:hypothetical protein